MCIYPLREGYPLLPNKVPALLSVPPRVACRTSGDLLGLALLVVRWNQTGPRLSLDALLLLTLPLLLTLTKFVEFPDVAESVHQLLRPLNRRTENNPIS